MSSKVRVRFAPSPTGGLHIGGVRTALFSYLFAQKNKGTFILRIEDTDQTRFVEGAEKYIIDALEWCGISPTEGPHLGGDFGPYRQSERKEIYKKYALELIEKGFAYYAFDTSEELEKMRNDFKTSENPSPQYDASIRMKMKNSLTLSEDEVNENLKNNVPYVIRIKVPKNEMISFEDMIRGEIKNDSNLVDDKVLLKADGMPTYHLAVVVDDYLMKISHAFRGEEWLPSAPIHVLLWNYFGWIKDMPKWAHLPLLLKPDGNGKLSKRDGERLGFPVFPLAWKNTDGELQKGFEEMGFLPEAFVNFLAMLGWNDGTDKEIFTKEELIQSFEIERIHKSGAKFDFEKAKWYNQEWIKKSSALELKTSVEKEFAKHNIEIKDEVFFLEIIDLIKERCVLLPDFIEQSKFFFEAPTELDKESMLKNWIEDKKVFFEKFLSQSNTIEWHSAIIEENFKQLAVVNGFKPNELLLPLRIMLVGGKFGPNVFLIAQKIGVEETKARIELAINNI
ncbi:MAG: glutamate--tRNA ligase [Chitinophagaceae bacterium]|nr:glutamate--tRNA ligase [Chitinophagaceae bacterium]